MTTGGEDGPDRLRLALACAALAFGLVAPLAYVAQRVVERLQEGPPDALLAATAASPMFYWRALTAGWWGVLAGALVFGLVARGGVADQRPSGRAITAAAIAVGGLVGSLSWLLP